MPTSFNSKLPNVHTVKFRVTAMNDVLYFSYFKLFCWTSRAIGDSLRAGFGPRAGVCAPLIYNDALLKRAYSYAKRFRLALTGSSHVNAFLCLALLETVSEERPPTGRDH